MYRGRNRSVLIVDDNKEFAGLLKDLLEKADYRTEMVFSVDSAIESLISDDKPMFVLCDRMLEGEAIEIRQLRRIWRAARGPFVVIYTTFSDLTQEQIYEIQNRGAIRVIDKKAVDRIVADIELLTQEFDELIDISNELNIFTSERGKLAAALVGSDVGVTIIDRYFHCWFANEAQERIVGQPCSGSLCWRLFHSHPVKSSFCWGCTVNEVFQNEKPIERLFLSRFADGSVKWVSVRSTPIFGNGTGDIIAVREGVTEATDVIVANLGLEERLSKIAQGLIHIGFGRVRIYRAQAKGVISLRAAAARSDDPGEAKSKYFQSFGPDYFLVYKRCPYASKAVKEGTGIFVKEWDPKWKESPFADDLELEPPYFTLPVYYSNGKLCGFLSIDFAGVQENIGEEILKRYANPETLSWIQKYHATEIRKAFESAEYEQLERGYYEIVQRARIGVGASRSVDMAIKEIRTAFSALVPNCRVSVRVLIEDCLEEYRNLCLGKRGEEVPDVIRIGDTNSLAVYVTETKRARWIDDYKSYRETASQELRPEGYCGAQIRSCVHIPLIVENSVFGTLSIDSFEYIDWESEGYVDPFITLTRLLSLIVRDLTMQRDLNRAKEDAWKIFTAGAAHRIGTRLGDFAGALDLLSKKLARAKKGLKVQKYLDLMDEAVIGMEAIIEQFKYYGTPLNLQLEKVDINKVVLDIVRSIHETEGFELLANLSENLPKVLIDEKKIFDAFHEIVTNALAIPSGDSSPTKIEIVTSFSSPTKDAEGGIIIEFVDDGVGIPPNEKEKVFDPFHTKTKGSGLGLAIVKEIIEEHDGTVEENGEFGKGARFVICLSQFPNMSKECLP